MPNNLGKIDHIDVLMMENRSFDNMLGWLYDLTNEPPFDKVPRGQTFGGLSGKSLSNPVPPYAHDAQRGSGPVGKAATITSPNPDPGEEYFHATRSCSAACFRPRTATNRSTASRTTFPRTLSLSKGRP